MKKVVLGTMLFGCLIFFFTGCLTTEENVVNDGSIKASGGTFHWTAQSPWPSGTTLHWMAEEIAKDITEATGGRLQIEMHPADSIVAPYDLLNAVDNGTLDAIHSWEGYWVGQSQAAGFFASMPLGMDEQQYMTWVLEGEGRELWEETFADFNVKVLPAGAYTPEIFYHSNVPIRNLEDLEGLRVRGSSFWAEIQSRAGANVIDVPGGEVYQALERGMVDAAEYGIPSDNWDLGFHEVTDYLILPGAHQPTSTFSFMVNKDRWDELPEDIKAIVQIVTDNMWGKAWAYAAKKDMEVMQNYRELEESGQLEIIEFSDEDLIKMAEITHEYYNELAEEDEMFRKVWESQNEFLETYNYWRDFMNPEYQYE